MYSLVLFLHSYLRWFVLIVGVIAASRSILGWLNNREWTKRDNQLGLFFMIGMDLQVLLGLILYLFLSPLTTKAFADFGAAMGDDRLRFFAADHVLLMIIALLLVHGGKMLPQRTTDMDQKHKKAAILFSIALAAILIATPWFRPLLRFS